MKHGLMITVERHAIFAVSCVYLFSGGILNMVCSMTSIERPPKGCDKSDLLQQTIFKRRFS